MHLFIEVRERLKKMGWIATAQFDGKRVAKKPDGRIELA